MKLKTILGIAVASCAAMIMSVATYAATDVKAGNITVTEKAVTVPIEVTSTDLAKGLRGYQIQINYDSSKFTAKKATDLLKYQDDFGDEVTYGSMSCNPAYGTNKAQIVWYINNADNLQPIIKDGNTLTIANIMFTNDTGVSEVSSNEFTFSVVTLADMDSVDVTRSSIFQFDVTGDLGGNKVVGLAASTDGGATKQTIDKYLTTTWTDGTDYANATTKFLVAVENTQGTNAVTDITIYGKLENGNYIPLSTYDQKDFLVQTFEK